MPTVADLAARWASVTSATDAPRGAARPRSTAARTHELAVKNWRRSHFQNPGPASRQEVQLLGEWLNSVLTSNLEGQDDNNSLEIALQAARWFGVAMNELIRQVSVACAERGRLLSVVWKRHESLFGQMVEAQRSEREVLLGSYRKRVQELRLEIEWNQSRMDRLEEEHSAQRQALGMTGHQDSGRLDALRKKLAELEAYNQQLVAQLPRGDPVLPDMAFAETRTALVSRLHRAFRHPTASAATRLIEEVAHFLDVDRDESGTYLCKGLPMLPPSGQRTVRPALWFSRFLSFLYACFIHELASGGELGDVQRAAYDMLMQFFGARRKVEELLQTAVVTARKLASEGDADCKAAMFLRFMRLDDPAPLHEFRFYLYCIAEQARADRAPLFPTVDVAEEPCDAIPVGPCLLAVNNVLSRFLDGRLLKHYNDRAEKMAYSCFLRFGGRQVADSDKIYMSLLVAYRDALGKLLDPIEHAQIGSFADIVAIMASLRLRLPQGQLAEIAGVIGERGGKALADELDRGGLVVPFAVTRDDFEVEGLVDNMVPFLVGEFDGAAFDQVVLKFAENEALQKQLRSARVKFEQATTGRATVKTLSSGSRGLFELIAGRLALWTRGT